MKLPSIAHRILQRIRPTSVRMELHTLADAIRAQDGKRNIRTEKLDKLTTIFNRMSLLPPHIQSGSNGASQRSLNMMSEHYMDLVFIRQELRAARIVFEEVSLGAKAIMKIDARLTGLERKTDDAEAYWQAMYRDNCDSALSVAEQTGKAKLAASLLGRYLNTPAAAEPEPITAPVAQLEPLQDDDTPLADAFLRHLGLREQANAAAPPSGASDLSWTYEQRPGEPPAQHIQRLTSVQPSELSQCFIALAPYAHVPATDRLNLLKTFGLISGIPDLKALKREYYELDDFPARPRGGAFRSLSSLDIELRQITAQVNRFDDGQPKDSLLACIAACSSQVASARAFWEGILSNAVNEHLADENSPIQQQLASKWLGSGTDASIPEHDDWNIGDALPDEDSFYEGNDALAPSHGVVPPSQLEAADLRLSGLFTVIRKSGYDARYAPILWKAFDQLTGFKRPEAGRAEYLATDFPDSPSTTGARSIPELQRELDHIGMDIRFMKDEPLKQTLLSILLEFDAVLDEAEDFWVEAHLDAQFSGDPGEARHATIRDARSWLGRDAESRRIVSHSAPTSLRQSPAGHLFTPPPARILYRQEVFVDTI